MSTTIINVEGMACVHCAKRVTEGVQQLAGVKEVSVNLVEKLVTIEHDETVDITTLQQTITDLGYQVVQ